ncbi:MAG: hypothetical protein DHS20C18_00140 [Saprospiraceae bacterium]|nr:MAG: hypothetical protein DHS20C18_00140 [Saprospiraceae bacterium]
MKIRIATPGDCECIAAVLEGAFSPFKSLYTDDAYALTVLTPEGVLKRMTEGITWVIEEKQSIMGTGSIAYTDNGLYITGMAVLPVAQGKKLGRKLLEVIEQYARQHRHQRMHLLTTTFLPRAKALYEKFGFQDITQNGQHFKGVKVLSFEKWLN